MLKANADRFCRNVCVGVSQAIPATFANQATHRPAATAHLSGRITELALEAQAFWLHRRIWQLLRREGLHVNHKRVYRLYHLSGLGVKRRRRRKGLATEDFAAVWRRDEFDLVDGFRHDALSTGRQDQVLYLRR